MSVLVVGSAALDTIETPYGKRDEILGGSAFYFSIAASYFTDVHVVAIIGSDFPRQEIDFLKSKNIDFSGLIEEDGKTFRWGGKYHLNLNDRDTLFTDLNVFENFNPTIPKHYQHIPYVFLANIQPELQMRVLKQMKNPKLVVLDTMNFWIKGTLADLKKVLQLTDILIINDSEAQLLANEYNLFKAAQRIKAMGPKILVIKKGEHGAILVIDDSFFLAPAYPISDLCDPTGAGDTFAGGFVGYLASTNDLSPINLRKAVVYGSIVGSFCVEGFGPERLKLLTKREIEQRYQHFLALTRIE